MLADWEAASAALIFERARHDEAMAEYADLRTYADSQLREAEHAHRKLDNDLMNLLDGLARHEKDAARLVDAHECPTCGQTLPEEARAKLDSQRRGLQCEIDGRKASIATLEPVVEQARRRARNYASHMPAQPQPSAELTTLQQRVRGLSRDRLQAQEIIRTADEAAAKSAVTQGRAGANRDPLRSSGGSTYPTLTASFKGTIDDQAEADEAKAAQRARAATDAVANAKAAVARAEAERDHAAADHARCKAAAEQRDGLLAEAQQAPQAGGRASAGRYCPGRRRRAKPAPGARGAAHS